MGHKELIDSLRKEGEESINQLWKEVKTEADKIKGDADQKIKELREKSRKIEEEEVSKQEESIVAAARNRARIIRLEAVKVVSDRLFPIARSSLSRLRDERYGEVFSLLVGELPALEWEEVRVNPQDRDLCRRHYPNARIIPDERISGGLEVIREEGRICIDNTFEKRLEIAWGDILPGLLDELYKEVLENESAATS